MNSPDGLGKTRIEAFSDGVFAIAITLLVLDVHVPSGLAAQAVGAALNSLWPRVLAYALSFVIVGVYWVAHHIMLHSVRRTDRSLLWLNNLVLLFVAFVPASASFLGSYPAERRVVVWYGINLVLVSGSLLGLWLYVVRARLLSPSVNIALVRLGFTRTASSMLIYAAAVALAFVNVRLSLLFYWLGPLAYIFVQTWEDRKLEGQDTQEGQDTLEAGTLPP